MRSAYLTIDDSPSDRMDDMVDFLSSKNIPALFFCRGDNIERHFDAAVRAVQKGFTLANHTYSHRRASEEDLNWYFADIEMCERLIEKTYRAAGVTQRGKYFRFPYLDRGAGAWIVDYDFYTADERKEIFAALNDGLNFGKVVPPTPKAREKMKSLQEYLKKSGYVQPFKSVTQGWYQKGPIAAAADSLFTFSNGDWMVTARHSGKWPYKSVDDLRQKAATDLFLSQDDSVNVILAHDQSEIVDVTIELIKDLADNGLKFLEV